MYDLKPPYVFVHKRVYDNPRAVARMERMLAAMGNPPIREVDVTDTDEVLRLAGPPQVENPLDGAFRQGIEARQEDPSFLFNTFVWDESARALAPTREQYRDAASHRTARLMAGVGDDFAFSRRDALISGGVRYVCQGGWGIHSLQGCPHKCNYCYEGYIVNVMLDLEEFAEVVYQTTLERPEQKLYRYDMFSDSITLEPEYGASAVLSEMFARTGDKYLLYYTKSDNVDHLLDLPHKSNAIFYLTLAAESQCRLVERDTPSMARRIEALRRCQQAGYKVRVGFSPIIPLKNWREEATECLEQLFAAVQPETVRLWALSLMSPAGLEACIGLDKLDPYFAEVARQNDSFQRDELFDCPFPREARIEIYRHYIDEITRLSPETPLSICSERREIWDALADRLTMDPDHLFCCCGGMSPPRGG